MAGKKQDSELGIKQKITKLVVEQMVVMTIIVMVILAWASEFYLTKRSKMMQEAAAVQLSDEIGGWMDTQCAYLHGIAGTIEYGYYNRAISPDYMQEYLAKELARNDDAVFDYYVAFNDGHIFYASGFVPEDSYDPRMRSWYEDAVAKETTTISDVYVDYQTKRYCITISEPIYLGDKIVGVVGADIFTDDLVTMSQNTNDNILGYMIVLDRDGHVIAHKDRRYTPTIGKNGEEILTDYKALGLKDKIIGGTRDKIAVQNGLSGVYRGITDETSNITVISAMSFFVYHRPVIAISILCIFILIFLCFAVKRILTKVLPPLFEPLQELEVVAENMSLGFLQYEADNITDDEIGDLCIAVEQSNKAILQYIKEITDKLDSMAEGDFSDKIHTEYAGDFVPLKVSINNTIKALRQSLLEISEIATSLNSDVQMMHKGNVPSIEAMNAKVVRIHEIISRFEFGDIDR